MDRYVSPRIAYWTSGFEPEMEAISMEVALLRRRFTSSFTWGLSPRHWALFSPRRGFCLHPHLHLLFRGVTRVFESMFQLHHIFGSIGDWFYLEGPRTRPTVLTMALDAPPVQQPLLDRIDRFVAEWPGAREQLGRLGVGSDRVRMILPPVNLSKFAPSRPPEDPFTVLFASSPERVDWLESRGVPQILDAAALRPDIQFRLLWRPWGQSRSVVREWLQTRALPNVELVVGRCSDMASQYNAAHATLAPFTGTDQFKPAPNSLIESLSCGRPVITSPEVGISELVSEVGGGLVCPARGEDIANALDRLQGDWSTYSTRARMLAEKYFSEDRFIQDYAQLYEELTPV
jgi:glycosyltransferase involved in cell wall biosynthesis